MEKRFFLALLLCLVVTYVYLSFATPRPPARRAAPATPPPEAPPPATAPASAPAASGVVAVNPGTPEDVVFEANGLRIVFSGKGAVAREVRLEGFYPDVEGDRRRSEAPSEWLAILIEPSPGKGSFGLRDAIGAVGLDLEEAPWEIRRLPADGGESEGIAASCTLSNGLTFEKEIRPGRGPFRLEVTVRVRNTATAWIGKDLPLAFVPANSIFREEDPYYLGPRAAAAYRKGYAVGLETLVAEPDGKERLRAFPAGELLWGASYNKYFASVAKPRPPGRLLFARARPALDAAYAGERGEKAPDAWRYLALELGLSFHVPDATGVEEKRLELYLGPKDPGILKGADPSYGEILEDDYGWFGGVSRTLLWILGLFHALTGSWGISIILLTLLVRGALFPVSRHQQVAMARFQEKTRKLQPELEVLKKKYKNDFRKFNEAQGRLFREHGLRPPVMGCLTMLLQMPVWFGLFSALRVAFELRHAPFLWIADLSQPDRTLAFGTTLPILGWTHLNVLPIAMTVVWFLQQKMAPKPADPQQAATMKIMLFFPFLMGYFLYNYASGLSLYMLASSTMGIFEAKVIRKATGLRTLPVAASP